jgi:hypothetical protein
MSGRVFHRQSDRCTLMASDPNRRIKISRAAEVSVTELSDEYISTRGRRRDPRVGTNTLLLQNLTEQTSFAQRPEAAECPHEEPSIQNSNIFRPTFNLPPTIRRRASPDRPSQRAATPHPRKATLPRCGSPKISQQPPLSFRTAGLVAGACCKWNREDYKHQLHLNWLNRS